MAELDRAAASTAFHRKGSRGSSRRSVRRSSTAARAGRGPQEPRRVPGRAHDHAHRVARVADVHRIPAGHHRPQARRGRAPRSCARLVDVADAQRRRIQRNLHDGAQQRSPLPSSRSGAFARSSVHGDRNVLDGIVDELAAGLMSCARWRAACIRRCSASAVSLQRSRHSRCVLPCRSSSPGSRPELPDSLEAAAYYVVAEALANVQKYAGAGYRRRHAPPATSSACRRDRRRRRRWRRPEGEGCAASSTASRRSTGPLEVDSPAGEGTRVRARFPLG